MELWSAERLFVKGRFENDWGLMIDESGIIQAIGPRNQLVSKAKKVWHYPGRLIMPALTNPHHHGFHTIFRGLAHQLDSYEQLIEELLWPLGQLIDDELLEAVYMTSFAEQVLSGTVRIGEFHYLHNGAHGQDDHPDYATKIIEIARSLGLEITLVYAFFDQGSLESAKAFIQPLDESIRRFRNLREKYQDNDQVDVLPGIHGFQHSSDEAILAAAELAKEFDCPWHIQLAEREKDLSVAKSHYGTTPLRALEKMGVLSDKLVIINGTLLDEEEIQMAARHNCQFVITPVASLAKGDGIPKSRDLIKNNLEFSIGSDSSCMNQGESFASELKWWNYINRGLEQAIGVLGGNHSGDSIWDLGTIKALKALGQKGGPLMPGARANFMMVDISGPTFRPRWAYNSDLFMTQLIHGWGARTPVQHLVIKGKTVVRNGFVTHPRFQEAFFTLDQWSDAFLKSMSREKNQSE